MNASTTYGRLRMYEWNRKGEGGENGIPTGRFHSTVIIIVHLRLCSIGHPRFLHWSTACIMRDFAGGYGAVI